MPVSQLSRMTVPLLFALLACARTESADVGAGTGTETGDGDGLSCEPSDRLITIVNQCDDTVLAAAVGNAGVNCLSNADCGVDQFCATQIDALLASDCTTDADCTGSNEFCDLDQSKCAFHQCFFVPLGGSATPGATACSSNADCEDSEYCRTSTGTCAAISTDGNGWSLAPGASVSVCAPTPWAGRLWPRTGCDDAGKCATGQCVGQDGATVSRYCGLSGSNPATLAEINMQVFGPGDFYDLSMVDGGNLATSLVPASFDDSDSNQSLISAVNCSADQDCVAPLSPLWRCDMTLGVCVNPLECGSPGCTDDQGCAASTITTSLLPACAWDGASGLAIPQSSCDDATQVTSAGAYVGCIAPQDLCGGSNPPASLACTDAPPCTTDADCASNASCDQGACTSGATSATLYGCDGAVNSGSCYSDLDCMTDADCTSMLPPGFACDMNAGKCVDPSCCGCPSWGPASLCVAGDNPEWHTVAEPFAAAFNAACGSAYSFAFDDTTKLLTCHGKGANDNVDYTVTFCP